MSLATESIVKISIAWSSGTVVYSDKTDGAEKGAILNFDVVALQGKAGDIGSVGSVNVTLDDTDGTLKTIYDTCKIEGVRCTVTQVFTGGVSKTRTLIVGKICADIVWSEGNRTLSFGIESVWSDEQIGYAPKDGDYAWLHPDSIGVPWPICFGSVLRIPAIHALKPWDLKLGETVKYMDPDPFMVVNGDQLPQSTSIKISVGEVLFTGTMLADKFSPTIWNRPKYTSVACGTRPPSDVDYNNPCVFWVDGAVYQLIRHYCIVTDSGVTHVNRIIHQEGDKCWCEKPWDDNWLLTDGHTLTEVARFPRTSWAETQTGDYALAQGTVIEITRDGWTLPKDATVVYRPDATITDRYICNLLPSEEVVEVLAHRTLFGKKVLTAVPSSYYTIDLSAAIGGGRTPTTITMTQPLSSRFCEGWEDDLYVSLISSVAHPDGIITWGGNTSEIIQWILEEYTDLSIDAASFAEAYTYLNAYPSNFAIFDQPNAVAVCQEIAWQARCSLVIASGVAYLKYLPAMPDKSPVYTLTNALTELKSIELGLLPTEDVITKITASWKREYSGEKLGEDGKKPERVEVLESNVSIYGLHELAKDFFIYNIGANVIASANFWLHRYCDVWKTISCTVFIDISDVNVFDYMLFNNAGLNFPSGGANGELTYIGHNTGEPIVEIKATLGVKVGTIVNSSDFWYVTAGSQEDVLDDCALYTGPVESDNSCASLVSNIGETHKKSYIFVFVETPKRIPRGVAVKLKAEIQDYDGNLVTEISPAYADLEVHSADRWDQSTFDSLAMTFTNGKWESDEDLIITAGDSKSICHLWINSLDPRIKSSSRLMGSM